MDSPVISQGLIDRWILEYECYELWKRFSDNLRTHQTWQTLFIDHISGSAHSNIFKTLGTKQQDDTELISMLLIKLMNSISNASKLPPDNNTEIITPLEDALKYIDQLNECRIKEGVKGLLMKLKKVVRIECVVICFRCYKLRLGKTVYERVWVTYSNNKECNAKSNLANLVKDDTNISASLESFPVSELTENCKRFFSKYFSIVLVPFVIRNAEKVFDVFPNTLGLASKKKKITSENSKSKHFLIQCWLADYFSYLAWKNMDHLDSVKFDWLLKFVTENNLETQSCLFIRFIFKFNERKGMEDSINSYLSPLEQCLELINKAEKLNSDECEDSAEALSAVKRELKIRAVLMWCSKNLYGKATIVFNRLFPQECNGSDLKLRSQLESVLKGHAQLSLDENKLINTVKNYFSKVFGADRIPYLLITADSVTAKMKAKMVKSSRLTGDAGNHETKKRQRTTKKLPDDFVSIDSIEDDSSNKRKKEFQKPFSHIDDEEHDKHQRNFEAGSENGEFKDEVKKKVDKKQRIWLEEEEELIYRGVMLYGIGNWSQIAKNLLVSRSNIDVKEKWRTMLKQGRIEKYYAEIGPIQGLKLDNVSDVSGR